MLNKQQMKK